MKDSELVKMQVVTKEEEVDKSWLLNKYDVSRKVIARGPDGKKYLGSGTAAKRKACAKQDEFDKE